MVAPSPDNIQLRAWIRDFILGGGEFTEELEAQIIAIMGTVLTTRGDLLSRGSGDVERRAIGASGTFPKSNGTDWSWSAFSTVTWTDAIPLFADYPDDRTITFRPFPFDIIITKFDAICGVGSTTLQLKKNGTNLGSSINPTTSSASTTYSSSNTFTANSDILSLVRSSTSNDCENLSSFIHFTRAII